MRSIPAVTTRPREWRTAASPAASSHRRRITPPCTFPAVFASVTPIQRVRIEADSEGLRDSIRRGYTRISDRTASSMDGTARLIRLACIGPTQRWIMHSPMASAAADAAEKVIRPRVVASVCCDLGGGVDRWRDLLGELQKNGYAAADRWDRSEEAWQINYRITH